MKTSWPKQLYPSLPAQRVRVDFRGGVLCRLVIGEFISHRSFLFECLSGTPRTLDAAQLLESGSIQDVVMEPLRFGLPGFWVPVRFESPGFPGFPSSLAGGGCWCLKFIFLSESWSEFCSEF